MPIPYIHRAQVRLHPAIDILQRATAWYDFDGVSSSVDVLADKSGGPNILSQANAGSRPTGSVFGYADFDGNDDELNRSGTGASLALINAWLNPGSTCCIVCAPDSDGGSDLGAIWDHGLGEAIRTVTESGGSLNFQLQGRFQLTSSIVVSTNAYAISTPHILFIRWNKSHGNAGMVWNINGPSNLTIAGGGLTESSAPSGNVTGAGSDIAIGGRTGLGGQNYDGKIYLFAWWRGLLSDADIHTLGTYSARKYSGTWA